MSTMQFEQPRGLASSMYQYQNQDQYSYPQPRPRPTSGYFQNFSVPPSQEMYPTSSSAQPVNFTYNQFTQPQSPYEHELPPQIPPKIPNGSYLNQSGNQPSQLIPQYQPTPAPPRRINGFPSDGMSAVKYPYQQPNYNPYQAPSPYEETPPLPTRTYGRGYYNNFTNNYTHCASRPDPQVPSCGTPCANTAGLLPPPQRFDNPFASQDDISDPVHYTRDPHKLVAYLIPFPKPQIPNIDPATIPTRFLIYTPPSPPLAAPKEGEKEGKLHKVQRKWQSEVRSAKTSTAKAASWQGVKSRATKAIAWGVNQTTSSNLEFLGRVDNNSSNDTINTTTSSSPETGVNELLLVYPPNMNLSPSEMRTEFVNTMLRTKTKAQRDSIIATGLLPVSFGIDIMATLIWPFGGLGEIDSVWLYQSARGAKTASSVTKRLSSSSDTPCQDTLHLGFTPSSRLDVLQRYLEAECHRVDSVRFPDYRMAPTETQVLEAIGWKSSLNGAESNWEDEQWEMTEVKEDVKSNMHKGAKEWKKFCNAFAKDPEKAVKK